MSLPYRSFERTVLYECPPFEGGMLARTTQRYLGLSRSKLRQGKTCAVAMYGLPCTPFADAVLTSIAWYPAACDVPWRWLNG